MSGSGLEVLPNVWEWSGCPPRCPAVVEGLPECPGIVRKSSLMSGSGWEALSKVQKWSEDPPGCLGVVGRPTQMSGSGREALPNVREPVPNVQ